MIVSDSSGSGGAVRVAFTVPFDETMEPLGFFTSAVMVVLPWAAPVTIPSPVGSPVVTDAIDGMLELHVVCGELVTSTSRPVVPDVASAMNWPVWPAAETDSEAGTRVTAVYCSDDPAATLKLAVPAIVLPPLL
jgi:hypothetical protein